MSKPIYDVIAQCSKTSQLFGELTTNLLQRYRLSLEDFLTQAQSEISWMRVQGIAISVTGVLTGLVGIGLAFMPKGAGNSAASTTTDPLSQVNDLASNGFLENMKETLKQNQEMIRGGLKAAKSALPLANTAGQTFTQMGVTSSQTAKNLTERAGLHACMEVRKEVVDADQRQHQNVQSIMQAYARTKGG